MFYTILITVSNFRTTNSLALLWTQNVFRDMWPLNLYLELIKAFYDFCQKVHDRKSCSAQLSYLTDLAELSGHIPLFGTNCIQWAVCISDFDKKNLLSSQDFAPKCMKWSPESDAVSIQSQWVHIWLHIIYTSVLKLTYILELFLTK